MPSSPAAAFSSLSLASSSSFNFCKWYILVIFSIHWMPLMSKYCFHWGYFDVYRKKITLFIFTWDNIHVYIHVAYFSNVLKTYPQLSVSLVSGNYHVVVFRIFIPQHLEVFFLLIFLFLENKVMWEMGNLKTWIISILWTFNKSLVCGYEQVLIVHIQKVETLQIDII